MDGTTYFGAERRINKSLSYFGHERRTTPWRSQNGNDERTLVLRAVEGDREAFARLYDRFVDKIHRYIFFKVGTRTEAEDLTAQVFLKAWEAIGHYQWTDRPISAWLYRIAHNMVVDYFRTRRETSSIDDLAELQERAGDLEELAQQHLTADILKHAITRLTPDQQQVILLRFIEGMTTEEVARIMGKQPGAVRTLQHRALAGLGGIFRRGAESL